MKGKINRGFFKKGHTINKGEKNYLWKGENVGYSYSGLHLWVSRWKGKPSLCEFCGTITAKKYEWANIDHKYRRVLEDYIRMCTPCHRKYDRDILKIKVGLTATSDTCKKCGKKYYSKNLCYQHYWEFYNAKRKKYENGRVS